MIKCLCTKVPKEWFRSLSLPRLLSRQILTLIFSTVYLFGFSRGAYTVRLLAALLLDIGVIDFKRDDLPKNLNLVENKMLLCGKMVKKWGKYQKDVFTKGKNVPLVKHQFVTVPSIEVLGLWDCVGSAGKTGEGLVGPRDIWAWGSKWKFAEELRDGVENAFHALALTERRRFFKPVPCKFTMIVFFSCFDGAPEFQDMSLAYFETVNL